LSDELEFVLAYHQATKHSFPRMAPGPKTMDWANEPRPFRRFRGAELVELARPEPSPGEGPAYDLALTGGNVPPRPLSFDTVSQLLFDSLAISAWRRAGGAAWALRVNPSSGNLHPTEGYLISGPVPGLFDSPTVAHYAPREHGLEVRGRFSEEAWRDMALPEGTVLVGLSSIPWREAWKYGERAFRYLHLNVGHALAALSFASAALGWQASLLDCLGTDEVAFLLGLTDGRDSGRGEVRAEFGELRWQGRPDRLSPAPVAWPLVAAMAAAAAKPPGEGGAEDKGGFEEKIAVDGKGLPSFSYPPLSLRKVIRRRRSSIAMDPAFSMTREDLFRALSRTIPGPGRFPFGLPPWRQVVDLAIYLHRVLGLDRGLYLLLRDPQHESRLRAEMRASFDWARPEGAPPGFFRLAAGDFRDLARALDLRPEDRLGLLFHHLHDRSPQDGPGGSRPLVLQPAPLGVRDRRPDPLPGGGGGRAERLRHRLLLRRPRHLGPRPRPAGLGPPLLLRRRKGAPPFEDRDPSGRSGTLPSAWEKVKSS